MGITETTPGGGMSQEDSLYGLLKSVAEHSPTSPAILGLGREPLTYAALIRQVEMIVECLNTVGIRCGDRVAIVIQNGPEAAVCCFAVSCGAISAPLNPAHSSSEFEFYFRDLAPKALIVDSHTAPQVASIAQAMGVPALKLVPLADEPAGIFRLECQMRTRDAVSLRFS